MSKKRKAVWEESAETDRNLELSHGSGGGMKVAGSGSRHIFFGFCSYRPAFGCRKSVCRLDVDCCPLPHVCYWFLLNDECLQMFVL